MRVIDHEPQFWFLFEDENERLILDVNCEYSFVSYDFMMFLSAEEISDYKKEGRSFLEKLANDINSSVPIAKISQSKYKERKISNESSEEILEAIHRWREENSD